MALSAVDEQSAAGNSTALQCRIGIVQLYNDEQFITQSSVVLHLDQRRLFGIRYGTPHACVFFMLLEMVMPATSVIVALIY